MDFKRALASEFGHEFKTLILKTDFFFVAVCLYLFVKKIQMFTEKGARKMVLFPSEIEFIPFLVPHKRKGVCSLNRFSFMNPFLLELVPSKHYLKFIILTTTLNKSIFKINNKHETVSSITHKP